MTITLTGAAQTVTAFLGTNSGPLSNVSGQTLWLRDGYGTNTWLAGLKGTNVAPGQLVTAAVALSVPSDRTGATYRAVLYARDAAGADLSSTAGPDVTIAPGAAITTSASLMLPSGTSYVVVNVELRSGAGSGRWLTVTSATFTPTASVDEIISGSLDRDQRRADSTSGTGTLILTQAAIGPRTGTFSFLCTTWLQVAAVDGLYRAGTVTLPAQGAVVPALTHVALGKVRSSLERTVNGRPARWLVTADIRELS